MTVAVTLEPPLLQAVVVAVELEAAEELLETFLVDVREDWALAADEDGLEAVAGLEVAPDLGRSRQSRLVAASATVQVVVEGIVEDRMLMNC